MTRRLTRLILLAALVGPVATPVLAAAPKMPLRNPPLPPARPVFPDDPPPAPADQAAAVEGSTQAAQYAPTQSASYGPFGALFAPAPAAPPQPEPVQTAYAQPASAQPASPQPVSPQPVSGPANYPSPQVDLRRDRDEQVEGFGIAEKAGLADLTRKYARQHGVPLALLHRIIMRESKYCPRLVNRRYFGLMQITPATARSMGYHGAPKGLLDPETNLAYAVPYLANAWALSDGDMDRAVRLYAAGYYYTAKSKGMLGQMRDAHSAPVKPQVATLEAPPPPPPPSNVFEAMFGQSNR